MKWLGIDKGEGDRLRAEEFERQAEAYRNGANKHPRTHPVVQANLEAAEVCEFHASQYRARAKREGG